jgi:hypothetical protein
LQECAIALVSDFVIRILDLPRRIGFYAAEAHIADGGFTVLHPAVTPRTNWRIWTAPTPLSVTRGIITPAFPAQNPGFKPTFQPYKHWLKSLPCHVFSKIIIILNVHPTPVNIDQNHHFPFRFLRPKTPKTSLCVHF